MPQITGGGATGLTRIKKKAAYEDMRRGRAQETSSNAPRASTPQETVDRYAKENFGDYGVSDLGKQVYNFPGKVYNDADQSVRGLIHAANRLLKGDDPGLMAEDMARGALHNWTHPVEYANEHPFGFMADLSGAALGGAAALRSGAGRFGTSVPEWLGSETGAIGPIGRRLEAGEVPEYHSAGGGIVPSNEFTATNPDLGVIRFPDESGLGVVKTSRKPFVTEGGQRFNPIQQAEREAAYNELNVASGGDLRMPGVQYGEWEHTPRVLDRESARGGGSLYRFDPTRREPGSLMEYVDNLEQVEGPEQLDWTNPAVRDQMRLQNIYDQVTGNNDRGFGVNQFATRSDEGLMPLSMDNGASFPRQLEVDTNVYPQAWQGDYTLRPGETEWLQRILDVLGHPASTGTGMAALDPGSIRGAINRARGLLERGSFR